MSFLRKAPRRASLSSGPWPVMIAITAVAGLLTGLPAAAGAPAARAAAGTATAPAGAGARHACAAPDHRGVAACLALVRTNVPQRPQAQIRPDQAPSGVGYGPASLQSAYNLPSSTAGWGQTVAVVDAYDDPSAAADLATYRSDWGLPPCNATTGAGCLTKVNENGQASPLPSPAGDTGWATEEALDIEMVAATCPNCRVLLVEANSASIADLGTAVNSAVTLGARYVSNSYDAAEYAGETSSDAYYNHPGVAVTAAAGDYGYGISYPAASPDVVSVGGTSLTPAASPRGWTETAWPGSGSGCSVYEPKPAWQAGTGCSRRTDNDVAAVADPSTGVAVYDTYDQGGWLEAGGTSVASPVIASTYALAGVPAAGTYPASYLYAHPASLNDITSGSGSGGTCTPAYLCTAGPGYDGPTGMGTPNGTGAFTAATVARVLGPGAALRNSGGNLEVFARGSDGAIWCDTQSGSGWGGWASLGGPATFSTPAAGQDSNGTVEVFDVAANGRLYHDVQAPGGGWSGWLSLGGTLSFAAPAVGRNLSGSLELFAQAPGGTVSTATQSASYSSGWTPWSSLGGSVTSPPAVGRDASGTLEIFAAGAGGAIVHDVQALAGGPWSGWASLGGSLAAATPAVSANTSGALELFALGTDGAVWTAAQSSGSGWGSWSSLGSAVTGAPASAQNSDGRLEVFAPAAGGQVLHAYQGTPGGSWSGWSGLGGSVTSSPAAALNSGGGLEIFGPAPGGAISYDVQTAAPGTWASWASLG